jgi:hypothetical protein
MYTSSIPITGDNMEPILADAEAVLSADVLATVGMISLVMEYPQPNAAPANIVPSKAHTVIPGDPDGKNIVERRRMPQQVNEIVRTGFLPNLFSMNGSMTPRT